MVHLARRKSSSRKVKTDETTIETIIAIVVVVGLFVAVGILDVGEVITDSIFSDSEMTEPVHMETVSEEIEIELAPAVTEVIVEEEAPEVGEATAVLISGTTLGSSSSSFDVM